MLNGNKITQETQKQSNSLFSFAWLSHLSAREHFEWKCWAFSIFNSLNSTHNIYANLKQLVATCIRSVVVWWWMSKKKPTHNFFLHCIPFVFEPYLSQIRSTHNTFGSWLCGGDDEVHVIRVAAAKWIGRIIAFIQLLFFLFTS